MIDRDFVDGITTIEFPDGTTNRASGVYRMLRREEVIEVAGKGKFTVRHFQLRMPPSGAAEQAAMILALKACPDPSLDAVFSYNSLLE